MLTTKVIAAAEAAAAAFGTTLTATGGGGLGDHDDHPHGTSPTGAAAAAASLFLDSVLDHCPCWNDGEGHLNSSTLNHHYPHRMLEEEEAPPELWETIVVSVVLVFMLLFMMFDKVGPDWVMVTALVVFMVCEIITIKEGLEGFANEGIITVMALFVVAEGVSRTGALDYYMGLLLGSPQTVAGAQIRLTIPIAILSGFLNNTPIVVVMIPLTIRWAKRIGVPKEQLLIPLSYATILGGTCTLVGTSTNLVVSGLLQKEYPDEEAGNIGLFDLAVFGVPNMMIGIAYMLACSPFLLPFGNGTTRGSDDNAFSSTGGAGADALLFGARVKPWSPAAGRTYKRSGLGNSGGIFLTNVRRAATGNIHTAVSKDFVISVGDELYFTGLVEAFGEFCKKHGLEIITKDNLLTIPEEEEQEQGKDLMMSNSMLDDGATAGTLPSSVAPLLTGTMSPSSSSIDMMSSPMKGPMKSSGGGKAKEMERIRTIRLLSDQIGGREPVVVDTATASISRVVVSLDETEQAVLVGVDCPDRPGLLTDISDTLGQQGLNLRHSEAKVFGDRSLSVWGCEYSNSYAHDEIHQQPGPDLEEIWAVLNALLLSSDYQGTRSHVTKKKTTGTQVVRAVVTNVSSLLGKKPIDVDFRGLYSASIVAYQKNGKNSLLDAEFGPGDLLVLETMEGSPLLSKPPEGFYDRLQQQQQNPSGDGAATVSRSGSGTNLYDMFQRSVSGRGRSNSNIAADARDMEGDDIRAQTAWKDLKVHFVDASSYPQHPTLPKGEFLTAFIVTKNSPLINKSLNEFGYAKLPGVMLISVERTNTNTNATEAISADDALQVGDTFWYSGSAEAIADLQKLHGLVFYHDGGKASSSSAAATSAPAVELTERRLVQAVVARGSPLVGMTVKDAHFRSVYGGVVIAIQRGSERVHELPANVKLQTGDVLLVEAGSNFVGKQGTDYRTFALVSEVENSSPPRPRLFLLCAAMIVTSLTVAGLEIRSLLITASIVGIIMVACGIVTQQEARDCLQWDLYMTIASAFGIGTAMKASGVAGGVATVLVNIGQALGIGDAGVYGAVYFAGNLLSAILTNNAAATLMFPIAMDAVDQTGADRLKMCYILMLSSSDYITSFGYQTNLMVYGPGEYRNIDFFKFGAPMQILLWLSTTAMVATLSVDDPKWSISWIVCAIGLIVVAGFRLTGGFMRRKNHSKKRDDEDFNNPPGSLGLTRGN